MTRLSTVTDLCYTCCNYLNWNSSKCYWQLFTSHAQRFLKCLNERLWARNDVALPTYLCLLKETMDQRRGVINAISTAIDLREWQPYIRIYPGSFFIIIKNDFWNHLIVPKTIVTILSHTAMQYVCKLCFIIHRRWSRCERVICRTFERSMHISKTSAIAFAAAAAAAGVRRIQTRDSIALKADFVNSFDVIRRRQFRVHPHCCVRRKCKHRGNMCMCFQTFGICNSENLKVFQLLEKRLTTLALTFACALTKIEVNIKFMLHCEFAAYKTQLVNELVAFLETLVGRLLARLWYRWSPVKSKTAYGNGWFKLFKRSCWCQCILHPRFRYTIVEEMIWGRFYTFETGYIPLSVKNDWSNEPTVRCN